MAKDRRNDESNATQRHVVQSRISIGQLTGTVDAFTRLNEELVRTTSDSVSWMPSVESGSSSLNTGLIADDDEPMPDVTPALSIFKDNVEAQVIRKNENGEAVGMPFPAYDSTSEYGNVAFDNLERDETSGPATYISVGSVTGRILGMNSKGQNMFTITDEETGQPIGGSYDDDLLGCFRHALKTRATVSGIVKYDRNGRIRSIEASAVRLEPTNVPRLSTLRGILKD